MEVLLFFITLGVERDWVYHQLPELNAELNSPRNVELNIELLPVLLLT